MPTYAALLRAVNVGGRSLAMAELRALCADLGFTDVQSYVQSGNIVLTSGSRSERGVQRTIEDGIAERFGLDVPVMLRSHGELTGLLKANPYAATGADPARLLVMFLDAAPKPATARGVDGEQHAPDLFTVAGREIYLYCPNGYGRSKLTNSFFERKLGVRCTGRNWRTVGKLVELTASR
ncbi:MAG TPA: DUF1697 domain-containing protein [Acidimicrobiia bacterium]|jgi:uncharacterized protein (DUF1697 family)